jgi:hypothetical protein
MRLHLSSSSPGLTWLDRAIQYSLTLRLITNALEYWAIRWSLSSGGALRRPGGGW